MRSIQLPYINNTHPAGRQILKNPYLLHIFIVDIEENIDRDSYHSTILVTFSEKIIRKEIWPSMVIKPINWEGLRKDSED